MEDFPVDGLVAETIELDLVVSGSWERIENSDLRRYIVHIYRPSTGDGIRACLSAELLADIPEAFRHVVEECVDRLCFGNPDYKQIVAMIPAPPPASPYMLRDIKIARLTEHGEQ